MHSPIENSQRRDSLFVAELQIVEALVEAGVLEQLGVLADLDDLAVLHHNNFVSLQDGAEPMGDDEGGAAGHQARHRVLNETFAFGVERAGGLIEDEESRIFQDRAGDGDALALAAAEFDAAFAHGAVVAMRQLEDEVVRIGGRGRGDDRRQGGVGAPVTDVVEQRAAEQNAFLHHKPDLLPERFDGDAAEIIAVEQNRAGIHVVEPAEQVDERGLAGAARTDECDHLAGFDGEINIFQNPALRVVAELHLTEFHPARHRRQFHRVPAFDDERRGVEDFVDFFQAGASLLDDGVHVAEAHHRRIEEAHVGAERDELADCELVVDHHPAADREEQQHAERFDGGGKDPEPGVKQGEVVIVPVIAFNAAAEAFDFALFGTETLDEPRAGDAFVEEAQHPVPVSAMSAAQDPNAFHREPVVQEKQRQHCHHHQGELPFDPE